MRFHSDEDSSNEETSDEETSGLGEAEGDLEIIIHSTLYMNGRATTRGVLKRMRFFDIERSLQVG